MSSPARLGHCGARQDGETCPRIFEPSCTTKSAGGVPGLGLAMVTGIVKQHRRVVRVHSEPNAGTLFAVRLPAFEHPAEEANVPANTPNLAGTETVPLA